jgi:AAA15 family ATPase/GTPase
MVAAKIKGKNVEIDKNNVITLDDNLDLLTSAGVYGANASGKSNLIKAFGFMHWFVLNSSRESQADESIKIDPFLLDAEYEHKPSFFEIVFIQNSIMYRYGFEVTQKKVETEWLFYTPKNKEAKLFTREGYDIQISRNFKGDPAAKRLTRSNALFLSVAAQFNSETSIKVLDWFRSANAISGYEEAGYPGFTANKYAEDQEFQKRILTLVRNADVGIENLIAEKKDINDPSVFPKDMPEEIRNIIRKEMKDKGTLITLKSTHRKKTDENSTEEVPFSLNQESDGTVKLFHISGPIIDTLNRGSVLFIDEFEARMHTMLTRKLISLFNSRETNPKHAQLIFATHDTNLLSNDLFRRDQIWFIEKDENGASHLYSLAELKVRNDNNFENDYLSGRYGGIPVIGDLRQLFYEPEEKNRD